MRKGFSNNTSPFALMDLVILLFQLTEGIRAKLKLKSTKFYRPILKSSIHLSIHFVFVFFISFFFYCRTFLRIMWAPVTEWRFVTSRQSITQASVGVCNFGLFWTLKPPCNLQLEIWLHFGSSKLVYQPLDTCQPIFLFFSIFNRMSN